MDNTNNFGNTFDNAMQKSPFDDMSLTLDTRYVDIGIGYNKKTGSRIAATIDLNSLGQTTEDDVRSAKNKYQEQVMQLDLERRRIINEKLAKGEAITWQDVASIDKPVDVKIDPTPQHKPPVFTSINPAPQSIQASAKTNPTPSPTSQTDTNPLEMGAKAYDE